MARRIFPPTSATVMQLFEQATSCPYGYLVVVLNSGKLEQDRLHNNIFESIRKVDKRNLPDVDGDSVANSKDEEEQSMTDEDFISNIGPPGKGRKVKLKEERSRREIGSWRFQDPLRQANLERFKVKVNGYEDQGYTFDQAVHHAATVELPYLRKRLRQEYNQFLIDF